MTPEDKKAFQDFVVELEKATVAGDIVWDVELLSDARNTTRRYQTGVVFSNGAVGCIILQHEARMYVNSHEYAEPEVSFRRLYMLVAQPCAAVLQMAHDGLRQRQTELCGGGVGPAVDLNEMGENV